MPAPGGLSTRSVPSSAPTRSASPRRPLPEEASAPLVSSDETFLQALKIEGVPIRGVPLARIHELADA